MIQIDFLPREYKQQRASRHQWIWRYSVVLLFAVLLGGTLLFQILSSRRVSGKASDVATKYETAQILNERLASLQSDLATQQDQARLATYVTHPWPTTQLMARIVEPLPESMTFTQLTLNRERIPGKTHAPRPLVTTEQMAEPAGAAGDLKKLVDKFDTQQFVITLSGSATKIAELHSYVARLTEDPLFLSADLALPTEKEFLLRVVVRPGYGQTKGPTGEEMAKAHTSPTATPVKSTLVGKQENRP